MGDSKRFKVTAKFLAENFKPCSVADVAGGRGSLSKELAQYGFECTVIDPRHDQMPSLKAMHRKFDRRLAKKFDLIIGLHPDEATEELCVTAASGARVVIIPCCNMWRGIENHGSGSLANTIRKYFQQHNVDWWETLLPITGKNLVFVANRERR